MKDLIKSLKNGQWYIESLEKVGKGYIGLMSDGLALIHPVSIGGKTISDDGIPYHTTIKTLNKEKDSAAAAHQIASGLNITPPDPKKTVIVPAIFKDRYGDDVHVLAMHGDDANSIVDHNSKFNGMGWPNRPEGYRPHITVDKATYDKAVQSGATTAADMGIEFGDAELRRGFNTLSRYSKK